MFISRCEYTRDFTVFNPKQAHVRKNEKRLGRDEQTSFLSCFRVQRALFEYYFDRETRAEKRTASSLIL